MLASQPSGFARNLLSGEWQHSTPLGVRPLSAAACTPTPGTIPFLPLLSPTATPGLGLHGCLASCTSGRSLEQVVAVRTDPLRCGWRLGGWAAGWRSLLCCAAPASELAGYRSTLSAVARQT